VSLPSGPPERGHFLAAAGFFRFRRPRAASGRFQNSLAYSMTWPFRESASANRFGERRLLGLAAVLRGRGRRREREQSSKRLPTLALFQQPQEPRQESAGAAATGAGAAPKVSNIFLRGALAFELIYSDAFDALGTGEAPYQESAGGPPRRVSTVLLTLKNLPGRIRQTAAQHGRQLQRNRLFLPTRCEPRAASLASETCLAAAPPIMQVSIGLMMLGRCTERKCAVTSSRLANFFGSGTLRQLYSVLKL